MAKPNIQINPNFDSLIREIGFTADSVFQNPMIKPWRVLSDRENCTLEFASVNGESIRWHVKRYPASNASAARREAEGLRLLEQAGIPTLTTVAWGNDSQGRTFTIMEDLAGFQDSEKLVRNGLPFSDVAEATAEVAARLHAAGLHHRDLYLCHFFSRIQQGHTEARLIDVARVRKLPRFLKRRWIVKDLAQFAYSMRQAGLQDEEWKHWLTHYCRFRGKRLTALLLWEVNRKVRWIARHDASLRIRQPNRNISIGSK